MTFCHNYSKISLPIISCEIWKAYPFSSYFFPIHSVSIIKFWDRKIIKHRVHFLLKKRDMNKVKAKQLQEGKGWDRERERGTSLETLWGCSSSERGHRAAGVGRGWNMRMKGTQQQELGQTKELVHEGSAVNKGIPQVQRRIPQMPIPQHSQGLPFS